MLKKTLMMFSILAVAGTAMAEDITNPFYLARKGQIGSITSVGMQKVVSKNKGSYLKSKRILAKEDVQIGVADSLAIVGAVGNTWDKWKGTPAHFLANPTHKTVTDNENFLWNAGLAWNALSGPTRLQVSARYGQDRLKNFDGEYKYVSGEAKLGYQFQRALPYITGAVEIPVGQKSGTKGIAGDKLIYNTKAGVYFGQCEVWAVDTGLRLSYDENTEERVVAAEAEASYYLTPTTTLGIYGSYALDGRAKYGRDVEDKSVGARLRWFF